MGHRPTLRVCPACSVDAEMFVLGIAGDGRLAVKPGIRAPMAMRHVFQWAVSGMYATWVRIPPISSRGAVCSDPLEAGRSPREPCRTLPKTLEPCLTLACLAKLLAFL